ncbi:FUSC family protein [Ancylobacter oerskovii]|uniref:FUSC family protein n=1 Tax=Ancylobacter oerskovii TaxID=459519 RepID=A0ABW4YT87_9HYPH|nr:FUSC family protein [Ancylobacter oerskovii]MBS7543294.1 FUSC family protein [Ancylobacter oerskovii]
MSIAENTAPRWRPAFGVDLGWRNVVFALRTAVAAVVALAIAYWLELQDPQWAVLTVYLLAQPTAGAALAKGAYRIVGTVLGAAVGLIVLALYSQAPVPLVGAIALWLALCFFIGAQMRNYTAYGFLLAGYTALLVGLQGAADPAHAWRLAFDRTAELLIGIACITAVSVIVFPRYAGVMLREQLADLFGRLSHYGATALRPATPLATFAALRRTMVEAVVKFDALRSFAAFEAPELRADDAMLKRMVREFLRVLAIARGLYVRIEDFQVEGSGPIVERLRPAMAATAALFDRLAADPRAFATPHRTRSELLAARVALNEAAVELEAMAGSVPFQPLAEGLLILHRARDLLHGLSMVMVSEAAIMRGRRRAAQAEASIPVMPAASNAEALLLAIRSALALVVMCTLWAATEWTDGFDAVSGLAIILFFAVNQDRPGKLGFAFLLWSGIGIAAAYAAMVLVLPWIEGYEALALFLIVALLPAGLMAGTPQYAWPGIAFGSFFTAEIGTSNIFQPDELALVNSAFGLLSGMAISLVLLNLFPVTSLTTRGRIWTVTIGRLLPEAARGQRHERVILGEIIAMLAQLLPRLSLDRRGEEEFLRGTLGAASVSLELGRLNRLRRAPGLSAELAGILDDFLTAFPAELEGLSSAGGGPAGVSRAETCVRAAGAALAALPLEPGAPGAALNLRAGASLRFIADRFDIDRAFFAHAYES